MDMNRITDADQDMGKLIQGAFHDLEKLATQHVKLFKTELKSDAKKAGQGALSLIVGLNIVFVGVVLLGMMLAHGLHAAFPESLPLWGAFGIVGVLICVAGGVFLGVAMQRFNAATPVAEKTLEELEEDAKWLTNPK
jgi:uncharacterized membrane protein YqjE